MSSATPLALATFGLLLGMRHALEPDHLAAVSTLVDGGQRRLSVAGCLGALWGLGHTVAILGLGGVLLLLRAELPERIQGFLELAVAGMLVCLGGRGLVRAFQLSRTPGVAHVHRVAGHSHAGDFAHVHVGPFAFGRRPLLIGVVHGLAGTGALTSLVMSTLPTVASALGYLASFGLGSLVGMALVTFTAGAFVQRVRSRAGRALLLSATALASVAYGAYWGGQQLIWLRL